MYDPWQILGLRPANEGRCYFVTMSLTDWAQAWIQPCNQESGTVFKVRKYKKLLHILFNNKVSMPNKMLLKYFFLGPCWQQGNDGCGNGLE